LNQSPAPEPQQSQLSGRIRLFLTAVLAGASVCLASSVFTMGSSPAALLTQNTIPLQLRLPSIAGAWGIGLVLGVMALLLDRKAASPRRFRERAVAVLAPWTLAVFVPLLFERDAWDKREFALFVLALGFGLALERTLVAYLRSRAKAKAALPPSEITDTSRRVRVSCLVFVLGLSLFYFFRIGQLTVISHHKMATMTSDLAEYDNMFFNALHGHPFRSPAIAAMLKDFSSLQGHAELALYLLLPFYALAPGAQALLWIQSGLVAFAAIPQYLLARSRMNPVVAMAFPFVHLTMPAVQQPNFYDFHFTSAGTFFVSWLLYFVHALALSNTRRNRIGTYVFMVCALTCREDVALGIAVLGLFLIIQGKLVKHGIAILLSGSVYFVTMKFAIMPLFGTWWFDDQYTDLKAHGAKGFGAVILTLLSNQGYVLRALMIEPKALYLLHMTAPVLALWLRRPILLMAILPGFVSTLLVTNRPPLFQTSFQYTYLWVPYVVAASILAIRRRYALAAAIPLVIVGLALDHQRGVLFGGESIVGGFGTKTFVITEGEQKRLANLNKILKKVPPEASVATTEAEGPHVSTRLIMYSLKFSMGHDPDYLLVGHLGFREENTQLKRALDTGKYGVIATEGVYILAKRGADTSDNQALLRRVQGR
jgi:uncharacterized membrane protein